MGIFLSILAYGILYILSPLLILFSLIKRLFGKKSLKEINQYYYSIALSLDQLGNVIGQDFLNSTMIIKENTLLFGNEDHTISYVIAYNDRINNLTSFGKFWGITLNFLDTNHLGKALENNENKIS